MYIISKNNKIYKLCQKLLTKKYRDKYSKYIIEGTKIYNDFKQKLDIDYLIIDNDKKEHILDKIENKNNIYILENSLFKKISSQKNSQGLIVVCSKKQNKLEDIKGDVLILDNIQDAGNLGTIIRTISAFGLKNLIITDNSVDEYSEKVIRASMGTICNINIYRLKVDLIIDFLMNRCYNIIITDLSYDSKDFKTLIYKGDNAYIFGNEGNGVSSTFKSLKHRKVKIPIQDNTESLNVAVSVGIFMYYINNKKEGYLISNLYE